MASNDTAPETYGAPGEEIANLEPAPAAAPVEAADSSPPPAAGGMVWRKGAQPAVEQSDLPPPVEAASGESVSEPEVSTAETDTAPAEIDQAQPEETPEPEPQQAAAVAHGGGFRVAPFVGIDTDGGQPLLAALKSQAKARGIALDGGSGAMVLKTYLSSYPDGGETVLTYVFDIYDAGGTRLTRIDGQEKVPGAHDGWADAPAELVGAVAKKAMRRLEAWQDGAQA